LIEDVSIEIPFKRCVFFSQMASPGSCEKVGAWQQALSLFSQIYQADLQPTLVSFNGTISACEKAKEWQQADFPVSGKNMS
jgi:hypothetical protein